MFGYGRGGVGIVLVVPACRRQPVTVIALILLCSHRDALLYASLLLRTERWTLAFAVARQRAGEARSMTSCGSLNVLRISVLEVCRDRDQTRASVA